MAEDVESAPKRRRESKKEQAEEFKKGLEASKKARRLGDGYHTDALANESTPDTSDGEIDDECQNKSAYVLQFSKRLHELNKNELIKYTIPCKDAPLPEVFMGTGRKLEVQVLDAWTIVIFSKWISDHFTWCANGEYAERPNKANQNLWRAEFDLEFIPWKLLCKTYGLTLQEITSPRMNAEEQPMQRLDVWLMKGSNKVRYVCLTLWPS